MLIDILKCFDAIDHVSIYSHKEVKIDFLQGGVFGPIVFLHFIHDIKRKCKSCFCNFIVDNAILYAIADELFKLNGTV